MRLPGALVSTVMLNEDILFSFKKVQFFGYHNLPYYILLGVLKWISFDKLYENILEKLNIILWIKIQYYQ